MRYALLIGFTLVLASCGKNANLQASCPVSWMPPAKYDHVPNPLPVELDLNSWDVDKACAAKTGYYAGDDPQMMSNHRAYGCFRYIDPPYKVPEIIVAKVGGGINQHCHNLLIGHEWGHANGWPDTHPNAVSAK